MTEQQIGIVEAPLFVWKRVLAHLCAALTRNPSSEPGREHDEEFIAKVGGMLIEHQLLTPEELELALRKETTWTIGKPS